QGQPGGLSLGGDPIIQALIREGEPAVEPLLLCLQRDTRLTRSVHFGRDFSMWRSLIGVHEAAYVAAASILQESFFEVESTADDVSSRGMEGRKKLAVAMRVYW